MTTDGKRRIIPSVHSDDQGIMWAWFSKSQLVDAQQLDKLLEMQ